MAEALATAARGGSWLLEDIPAGSAFTPERMTEEQRLIDQTTREFVMGEVLEQNDRLEAKDWDLARRLLLRCGELGILGTDVPEQYGGIPLDTVTTAVIAGRFGMAGSFSTTFGAQTGLAILPILAFGTEAQKQRYLPGLVSGECVGAYCLSEAGAGSDALGAKTRADRQADGSFLLNGEKMWISNGGFADVYIVFAKVGGEQFTAFIVERAFDGVSSGAEEHKMGLNGSSTTPVIFQDARVPADNLLGEIGKGHKVAFNVLNYGRFKLGASTVGSARGAIGEAARYAAQRRQFGQPIANFGAIKHKLGEMTIRTFAIESMVFRTAGLIDAEQDGHEGGHEAALLAALEEHAIESSILKVAGSEILDYVLDENVQIHGGNGYVRDYPAEGHYRDARVNRIFEGTNEINRLLIPGMLVRRALKGHLPLIAAADEAAGRDPHAGAAGRAGRQLPRAADRRGADVQEGRSGGTGPRPADLRRQVVGPAGGAVAGGRHPDRHVRGREHGAPFAECTGESGAGGLQADATRAFVSDAAVRIDAAARSAIAAMTEGDALRTHLAALRRLLKVNPLNTVAIRRRLADETVARAGYIF